MNAIAAFLIAAVFKYRYILLYPVTVVEGPLITMAVGFAVQQGIMRWWFALPVIIAGDLTGDLLYYSLGRFGERWRFTQWLIHYFRLETRKEKMIRQFADHGGKLILFGKLSHAAGAAFLVAAGYSRMKVRWFLWYNFIGTAIKSSILLYVGYIAGAAYTQYAHRFEWIAVWVTAASIVLIFALPAISRRWFAAETKLEDEIHANDTEKN